MEELEQEPEELPMEDVLAEIRHMLSSEVKENKESDVVKTEPVFEVRKEEKTIQEKLDFFLLTPEMRCDLPSTKELSRNVQKQTQKVLDKLQKDISPVSQLSPELEDWLNKNLPALIEKTVKEKFS